MQRSPVTYKPIEMRTAKTIWLRWAQEVLARHDQKDPHFSPSRRQFLQNSAKSAIAYSFTPVVGKSLLFSNSPKIAIIGGGLAGLSCAWRLKKAGISSTIYEASDRVGGRTHTVHDFHREGMSCEIGGEYFNSNHHHMLRLARELSLKIQTVSSSNRHVKPFKVFLENKEIPLSEIENSLLDLRNKLFDDLELLPELLTWENSDRFSAVDSLSITEYLKSKGADNLAYSFLCKAFTIENGIEANEQSALNLLKSFRGGLEYHPSSRLKSLQLKNGNQSMCQELSDRMWNTVQFGHKLVNLHQHTGWYKLQFRHQGKTKDIEADYVVVAVPFSVLRKIESDIHFPERKQQAINELGYGQKGSLLLSFDEKTWRNQGYDGLTFSDELFGYGNDMLPRNRGKNQILSIKPSGKEADKFLRMDTAEAALKSLRSFEKIYPGIFKHFDGQALKFSWSDYPLSLGSNSCYKTGQYARFGGEEGKSVENLYFAGEHCSLRYKGTMNGAVESGYLAADSLIRRVKSRKSRATP